MAIVPAGFDDGNPDDVNNFEALAQTIANGFATTEPYASNQDDYSIFRADNYIGKDVDTQSDSMWYNQTLIQAAGVCDYNQIIVIAHSSGWAGGAPGNYSVVGSGTPPTCDPTTCTGTGCPWTPSCSWDENISYTALHETGHTFAGLRHTCYPESSEQKQLGELERISEIAIQQADDPVNCGVQYPGSHDLPCNEWNQAPFLNWVLPGDLNFGCYSGCDDNANWYRPWNTNTSIMCIDLNLENGFTPVDRKMLFDVLLAYISDIQINVGACDGGMSWKTADEVNTWLEYGLSPNYTWQIPGEENPGTYHSIGLRDLSPKTTYHYRIVSRDAQDITHMTEDRTFSTRDTFILGVPQSYSTIQSALSQARACDIVEVGAGTYQESDLTVPEGVSLKGNGWQNTIIDGGGADAIIRPSHGSLVDGFTIRGSGPDYYDTAIWVASGSTTVQNNRITGNANGIWAWCSEPATCAIRVNIQYNIIDSNSINGVNSNEYAVFEVRHDTVVGNGETGIILNNAASLAQNNIIVSNGNGLVNNAGAAMKYNDVWGNGQNFVGGDPGEGALSMNPMFRSIPGNDYRLHAGSPAVGHGTPVGTDLGALPFTSLGNPPTGVTAQRTGDMEWTVTWLDTGAVGYNVYLGTLSGLYTNRFDVGNATTVVLSNLEDNPCYFVAVSGYNIAGDESLVSSEVTLTKHRIFLPLTLHKE